MKTERPVRRATRTLPVLLLLVVTWISTIQTPVARAQPAEPATGLGSAPPSTTVGPFVFAVGPYELDTLPIERLPYYSDVLVPSCGLTDGAGVAIYRASDGMFYNHPVSQAQCAINMMRNYRITSDSAYLDISMANAQRLIDTSVTHLNASFYPYPFRFINAGRNVMEPPWYSAMAQGQALTAFVRLYEWTGDPVWRDAADRTFRSFTIARASGRPWVAGVENGMLWLDEYPTVPLDRVYNGHNFAIYGLYDYWRITGNTDARLLALGALHSSYAAARTARVPGGISYYCVSRACLDRSVKNPFYHVVHAGQLRTLFHITGHWHFASLADAFTADSPAPSSGWARLAAGTHDAHTLDASGSMVRVSTHSLASTSNVTYSRREVPGAVTRPGNGVWLRIADGPMSGLYVRESARATPLGFVDNLDFWKNRPVKLAAGGYTGRTYAPDGTQTASATVTAAATTWAYTRYARINGLPSVLLSSGPLAGQWLTLDQRTVRDTTLFTDVDASIFRSDIIWMTTRDITRGCRTYQYCPTGTVTREQMASFLARALRLPTATRDYFSDDTASPHQADINRLAASGITAGCGPGRFCPSDPVSREQMASFLARALKLRWTTRDYFTDDAGSPHEADINRLAAAGITSGCADRRFCPTASVSRGQMAAFLHRALGGTVGTSAAFGTGADDLPSTAPPDDPMATPEPSATSTPGPSLEPAPTPTDAATPGETEPPPAPSPTLPTPTPTPAPTPTPTPTAVPTPTPLPTDPEP